ncbi:MAG: 9-O-acetylesterase [Bacteroidales bacterium]|nr:9-O-acetylesterase [Bacteroidales bacterium]
MKQKLVIKFLILFLFKQGVAFGLNLPRIFADNMVLQRNVPCKVWGWANPLEKVILNIDGESTYTYADINGNWNACLPPHKAGGPYTLEVKSDTIILFKNVMFGEIWIASGQSNMEFRMMDINDGRYDSIMANGNFPNIRYFHVKNKLSSVPHINFTEGQWVVCTNESIKKFSAVAWFFIKNLYNELNVPVAIIDVTWGATPAEAWTSQEMLVTLPFYRNEALKLNTLTEKEWERKFEEADKLESLKCNIVKSEEGFMNGYADIGFDDSAWETIQLPKTNLSDVVWVRKVFDVHVKKNWVSEKKQYTLNIGQAYIFHDVYFNGTKLSYEDVRNIKILASDVKNGENILAIRATSPWSNLVHIGLKDAMYLATPDNEKINLEGGWKYNNHIEPPIPDVVHFNQKPAYIFNAMINPLIGYSIKGAIWYQGESNVDHYSEYFPLFTTMIQDWRTRWEQGNFPFLFVQLANYLYINEAPTESKWAEIREAQRNSLVLPNTGMAVTIDIGETRNIHPFNKKDVGQRLSLQALKLAYGYEGIVYSGPLPISWEITGNRVKIKFEHIADSLKTKDGRVVKGFALAGDDNKYHWAEAQIEGNTVIVFSENVSVPVKIRYAWADNPECNLINSKMLPASPFQIELNN